MHLVLIGLILVSYHELNFLSNELIVLPDHMLADSLR